MTPKQVIIFNQAHIQQWEQEIFEIPAKITQSEIQMNQDTLALENYNAQLSQLNIRLHPIETILNAERSELHTLQFVDILDTGSHMMGHQHHHGHHHHHNFTNTAMHMATDITRMMRIQNLQANIARLNDQASPLKYERDQLSSKIRNLSTNIHNHQVYINNLHTHKKQLHIWKEQAKQFLITLRNNPQYLFIETTKRLLSLLEKYKKEHQKNQSIPARICLIDIKDKIGLIQTYEFSPNNNRNYQIKLALFIGYLWHLEQTYAQHDSQFFRLIDTTLENLHMDANSDLPDDMHQGISCLAGYQQLQMQYSPARAMNEYDLHQLEENQFDATCHELRELLDRMPKALPEQKKFIKQAKTVLHSIEKEKNTPTKSGSPDVNFLTHILSETIALVKNPASLSVRQKYEVLANEAHGLPNQGKKIAAAMLMLVGTALILTCLLSTIATLGISTPLGSTGNALGAALILGGIGLFANGMRKGSSKIMLNTLKTAETIKTTYVPAVTHGYAVPSQPKSVPEFAYNPEPSAPPPSYNESQYFVYKTPSAPAL